MPYQVVRINPSDMVPPDREMALRLMEWHGGQGTALYAVASSWYAGRAVRSDLVEEASTELSRTKDRKAIALARKLDAAMKRAARENPSKGKAKGKAKGKKAPASKAKVKPASEDSSILSSLHTWAKKKAAEMAARPPKQDLRLLERYATGDYVVFSKAPRKPLVRVMSVTDKVVRGKTYDGTDVTFTADDMKFFPVYPRRVLTAGEKIIFRQSQEFTVDEHSLADYVHAHADGQPPRSISVPTKDITSVRNNPTRTPSGKLRTKEGRVVVGHGGKATAQKLLRMRKEAIEAGEKPPARIKMSGGRWMTYENAAIILGMKSKAKGKAKAKPKAKAASKAKASSAPAKRSSSREIVRRPGGDMLDLIADSFGR